MRIAVIALLVLVATGCGSGDPEGAPPEQTATAVSEQATDSSTDAAPALSGESLEGESLALGDFRGRGADQRLVVLVKHVPERGGRLRTVRRGAP